MKRNYLYMLTICLLCTLCVHSQAEDVDNNKQQTQETITASSADEAVLDTFDDLLSMDFHEDGLEMHEHLEEEIELAALEPYASKPSTPSELSVFMRKVGIKMLIGYIAFRTYFDQTWGNLMGSATRLRQWISGSYVNQA